MFGRGFPIGSVGGIEIRVLPSWLTLSALLMWYAASNWLPARHAEWSPATLFPAAVLVVLLVFASVLLHELGHACVAARVGIGVRSITLFIHGGFTRFDREAEQPAQEFWIATAGPVVSAALAGTFYMLGSLAPPDHPLCTVMLCTALFNGVLALVNLLPGLPLDGGSMLSAAVRTWTASHRTANAVTVRVGRVTGYLAALLGATTVLGRYPALGAGLMIAGVLLLLVAAVSKRRAEIEEDLSGFTVADLELPEPSMVSRAAPLSELVDRHVRSTDSEAYLVTDAGRLMGLLTLDDILKYRAEDWPRIPAGEAMSPLPELRSVQAATPLTDAAKALLDDGHTHLPVVEQGRGVGILGISDIVRFLQTRRHRAAQSSRQRHAASRSPRISN